MAFAWKIQSFRERTYIFIKCLDTVDKYIEVRYNYYIEVRYTEVQYKYRENNR